jgi:hypothetical protein
MNNKIQDTKWSENVILVDADYVDKVAFNLTVNFERMIGRRIPKADMAKWIVCVALDGGVRPPKDSLGSKEQGAGSKTQSTLVVLVHKKEKTAMENFEPGVYEELNGKAFKDKLGEFTFSALTVEELTTKEDFFVETLQLLCAQKEVKRLMIIPSDNLYNKVREALRRVDDDDKRITVFSMEPREGGNFRQEILGYSLMAALGIRADEIHE